MIRDALLRDQGGADALVEGYYLHKVGEGRVLVPIRIWFGPPTDPIDGSELDRAPRWQIEVNGIAFDDPRNPPVIAGRPVDDVASFWPRCAGSPTDAADYRYRVDRADYAEAHDAADPFARTGGKVDPMQSALPF